MSTGLNCTFYEVEGKWFYLLENWSAPKGAGDWREYATGYGPFDTSDQAHDHLRQHHANPGGCSTIRDVSIEEADDVLAAKINEACRRSGRSPLVVHDCGKHYIDGKQYGIVKDGWGYEVHYGYYGMHETGDAGGPYWVVNAYESGVTRADAEELWGRRDEVTTIVAERLKRGVKIRLSAMKNSDGRWKIEDYDWRTWSVVMKQSKGA